MTAARTAAPTLSSRKARKGGALWLILGCALLAGCAGPRVQRAETTPDLRADLLAPGQAAPKGACLTTPGDLGKGAKDEGAEKAGETRLRIPCPAELLPGHGAALQRALAARGLYRGPITGQDNPATAAAIRAFQAPLGLDSAILSQRAAQALGLVPVS